MKPLRIFSLSLKYPTEYMSVLAVAVENRALECALLLTELMVLVNQPSGSMLPKLMMQVLVNWLSHRGANSCVLQGLLRVVSTTVTDHLHLGIILEASLVAWFKNSGSLKSLKRKKIRNECYIMCLYLI